MDEVDVARERLSRADRDLERRDLGTEGGPKGVERPGRIRVLAIALVDEEAGRRLRAAAEGDRRFEAGLDPARGVHDEDRAVGRVEARDDLGREVEIAGGVDQGDSCALVLERGDREAQRLSSLLLLGLEIEVGRAVIDAPETGDAAGSMEELFAERRLAGPRVAGQDDAPKVGQIDALHGHGPLEPRFWRRDSVGGVALVELSGPRIAGAWRP